ncbi:hypothetical protein [Silanimonas algicola]
MRFRLALVPLWLAVLVASGLDARSSECGFIKDPDRRAACRAGG